MNDTVNMENSSVTPDFCPKITDAASDTNYIKFSSWYCIKSQIFVINPKRIMNGFCISHVPSQNKMTMDL
jgi:hypothetical protein